MRVLVTRPAGQSQEWLQRLQGAGIDAAALPLIAIEPLADAAPLRTAWATLADRRLVMFVSANAAAQFFAARPAGAAWPEGVTAASPGPGTTAALRALGVPAAAIVAPGMEAAQFDSEALWARLSARDWQAASALIVCGERGRDWLAQRLREAGAAVDELAVYRRTTPVWDAAEQARCDAALADPAGHLWWFSSAEAIDRLAAKVAADWQGARALATHPRIAARARQCGFGEVLEARPAAEDVLAAIHRSLQSPPL